MSNDLSSLKASINMAMNAISQVEADVSVLKAQVEEIDGDYPCMIPGIPGGGASLDVAGTPALFKVCALVGWKKTSAESEWEQMSLEEMIEENPTRLWTEFKDGEDSYPWKALRPTWDYVRAYDEEEA